MKYGVAIFPSKAIQDEANAYRKRYDTKYELIPPHITLKDPYEVIEESLKDVITEIKKIANDTKPFNININKVSTFAPVTNTIYYKVEPIQELIDLHNKMQQDFFTDSSQHNFVPHITIAQNLMDDEY